MFIGEQVNRKGQFILKNLFTISQVTKSCNVSRSTLLRLEKRGLLTPALTDEESGYRYFDNHNVTRILQIRHLLDLGLSYDEIYAYFDTNGTSKKLLRTLEQRMYATKRMYEEMSLRIARKQSLTFETVALPKYVCYARECRGSAVKDKYSVMYALYHEVIEKGLRPLASEPLFTINKNTDLFGKKEETFVCCIPLEPDDAPEDALILKGCRAFSCLCYGSYDSLTQARMLFRQKIKELGIKPIGYPRVLGIVAPYTAREFKPENYVSRIAIPIASDDENTESSFD